ncbi:carboxymuconolactone decarboxylase family protein [Haloechinothrix aidingensis]|nr:carboxymuconolactone decarboxylase family protein [Haloechinothrix aidingensis]
MPLMSLAELRDTLPDYAKDTKVNLDKVIGSSTLPDGIVWGTALACAYAARNGTVLRAFDAEARRRLSAESVSAAKAAGSIMAMSNVFYRAKHMLAEAEYDSLPAKLRMQVTARPGVDKVLFELWSLAVSAISGCQRCLESHEQALRRNGTSRETVHEALRIASVVHAAAVTVEAEEALAEGQA